MGKDNVTVLPVITTLDLPPERVLQGALQADLESVLVIGRRKDGTFFIASSMSDGGEALWELEQCKLVLLGVAHDG